MGPNSAALRPGQATPCWPQPGTPRRLFCPEHNGLLINKAWGLLFRHSRCTGDRLILLALPLGHESPGLQQPHPKAPRNTGEAPQSLCQAVVGMRSTG